MYIDEEVNMTLEQVLSWGIFALIALVVSILVYIELAKSVNRIEHIKTEFLNVRRGRKNEKMDEKNSNNIIDLYLLIAMSACIVYMICVEVM